MAMYETFPHAPITEALLDIQATLPESSDAARLLEFESLVKDRFPEKKELFFWEQGFQLHLGKEAQPMPLIQRLQGHLFVSPDKTKLVQARVNGFTFNKLKPYESWDKFNEEARELWEHYRAIASPVNVTRVALRYLNRIEIPLPIKDLKDWGVLFPDVPPDIPQGLTEFFLRFVTPDPESGASGIITMTFEPPHPERTVLPLILDVDVFYSFDLMAPKTEYLWGKFAQLRELKNKIFFSIITENAKNLFR